VKFWSGYFLEFFQIFKNNIISKIKKIRLETPYFERSNAHPISAPHQARPTNQNGYIFQRQKMGAIVC